MKVYTRLLPIVCALAALVSIFLLLAAPTAIGQSASATLPSDNTSQPPDVPSPNVVAAPGPVVFLHDPNWPPYAQTEITVDPEPPIINRPTEICAWVVNTSGMTQTVTIDFEFTDFGIGLLFTPIGGNSVALPPHSQARACVIWIPHAEGHWCFQAILHQPGFDDQISQRNIDVWETLQPGAPAPTEFTLRNPLTMSAPIHLEPKLNPRMVGWQVSLPFTDINMGSGQQMPVTMIVTPPLGIKLGTRDYIVDVEATTVLTQTPVLIGGFRKMDWPPVPLHVMRDPPYAESEITVEPYPPMAGEPTRICVELTNQSDIPQPADVIFQLTDQLGIGLEFIPIDQQSVVIPPHGTIKVCTMWIPPKPGQFCIQIIVHDPQNIYVDQVSQRNLDVAEVLIPGQRVPFTFPLRNPNPYTAVITMSAMRVSSFFDVFFDTPILSLGPGEVHPVTLFVTRLPGSMPEPGTLIADLEARFVNEQQQQVLLGGIRKEFHPPISIHRPDDPPYAEREISIEPYPPRAGEPTEICVELRNPTDFTQTIWVEFAWGNFGIGLPFHPFHGQLVTLPPHSIVKKCTVWVPPSPGHFCVQVSLTDPDQHFPTVRSQRNMDVDEVFVPGQWTKPLVFLVGNPSDMPGDIEIVPIIRREGWMALITPTVLARVAPLNDYRPVTLTVMPPPGVPLPEDDTPVVDVEGYIRGQLIGGFRKTFRPPVPIHRPGDPIYAESEISINPYPPREREPTEICVDVRNPTDAPQTITVTFAVANFGIGLPFHDIARPIAVTVPPNSIKRVCVTWVPPFGGHFCARVTLQVSSHKPVWSQRNMDVSEILIPGRPSALTFPVGNPTTRTVTVTLGLVPHLEWDVSLSQDVLRNLQPGDTRMVTLVVTPPLDAPEPEPDQPVVDVEGYIGRELIGGFRKVYRPPVPIHVPKDPSYAESEIFVDPYPTLMGLPTLLGAEVFNPTPATQQVTVSFSVANLGIGMPFTTTGLVSPTMVVTIPPFGMARAKTLWLPWLSGHFCAQVILQSPGHEPVRSQRNIDVGEPLSPDKPHSHIFEVRNPTTKAATITLALVNHRGPDWTITLTPTLLMNVGPGEVKPVTLTVKPPSWEGLADEQPIADVEAYINGELIGGIRKIAKPPIPLHKPQDRPYAESEISVTPYPLVAGKPATITTQIMNTSDVTQTIRVEFRVANFGIGIPFTDTNIVPTYRVVTLGPGISMTVGTVWRPPFAGNWCIQITLLDPDNQYPPQYSQRNVVVEQRPANSCEPIVRDFWLQNSTGLTVTVTLGSSAVNLPPGWTYSTNITDTVLGPYQGITVTLTITPPCGLAALDWLAPEGAPGAGASSLAEINVEGYVDGKLMPESGGIQVQIEIGPSENKIYLPIVIKNY